MTHPLLEPISVGGRVLANRVSVAPMSRVSTRGDGVPTSNMAAYYAEYARGGFGLVITEGTYTDHAHSQAYPNQPAIVTEEQVRGWARVTDAVHAAAAPIFLQLMHAGALVQGNHHRDEAIAPSAVQPKGRMLRGYGGPGGPYAMPREMTRADIEQVIDGFAASAARARTAGFDGVEVHAANGYLFDQFITPYTNLRGDEYGGSAANRARLVVEVVQAIHDAAGADFPVGVRVSQLKVNDVEHRWTADDARAMFAALGACAPAYVHVAAEGKPWPEISYLAPGLSVTRIAREVMGVPVIANGGLHDAELAGRLVREGDTDLVSLGHAAIANPDWPTLLADGRPFEPIEAGMLEPEVTIENTWRWRETRARAA
jgi:2,4-dienoyl-CoA reductase-like NADH-dependent reductase (Old Yellow Enzyme family)